MISKDQSIIMQVAAKIAAELCVKSENMEATLSDWEVAFNFVNDKLQTANGVEMVKSAFPGTTEVTSAPRPQFTVTTTSTSGGDLTVAGKQHGDLPKWLLSACAKAGVSRVWDNRDTAIGTKRPWFKQADAPEGAEPAAFWPPKGA
jgi:hypothetical protein